MKIKCRLSFFLLFAQCLLHSQTFLRVTNTSFNNPKSYDIFINEVLEYKLKGQFIFHKAKLIAMSDSTLVFANDIEVKWNQLKALRVNKNNHLVSSVSFIFIAGGVVFFSLNTINNIIIGDQPALDAKAAYISAALVVTGYLIKQLEKKQLRIKESTYLKVLTINYQDLNKKDTGE
ncbi:hypothetical protein [Aurantibacillus circumpalustris]|uniref:hypothetical protein n=1 Tax=Aurantibacillus circumpalustris TaxID=3036359 RepID=UPI00295BAE5F|nr:hypothetical protein [Aurantibacillus circumpalustris]